MTEPNQDISDKERDDAIVDNLAWGAHHCEAGLSGLAVVAVLAAVAALVVGVRRLLKR